MKRGLVVLTFRIAVLMTCLSVSARPASSVAAVIAGPVITTMAAVRALTPAQAREGRPVHVSGIVTFYDPAQGVFFVQDSTAPVYIDTLQIFPVVTGSRVEIWGKTEAGYSSQIFPTRIRELFRGPLPKAVPIDYEQAYHHDNDCRYVTMQGIVRSATRQSVGPARIFLLQFEVDQHLIEVAISNYPSFDPAQFLDATVRVSGVVSGNFNQKEQIVGLQLMVDNSSAVSVVAPALVDPLTIPVTPLSSLLGSDRSLIHTRRTRTRGVLTLYDPGEKLVIKDGENNLLVQTRQEDPAAIGQQIEVTGFPSAVNGSPALENAQFTYIGGGAPLLPRPISFGDAMSGLYGNELVALEGEVVSETNEGHLDTLILRSGQSVFQAVYRKRLSQTDSDPIPTYQFGTRVRVIGVCIVHIRGFWGATESFQIHLRSAGDITVIALPSWFTIRHMLLLTTVLLSIALVALAWGLWMRRRLSYQEKLLRQRIESEAARLATLARLEHQRSHILELINSFEPLPSVLTAIHSYAAEMWPGTFSYSHMLQNRKLYLIARSHLAPVDSVRLAVVDPTHSSEACANAVRTRSLIPLALPHSIWSRPLISSHGEILGTMTFEGRTEQPIALNVDAFDFGCNLAAIAIDNRRLYDDVLHRSQHDQLTGLPNRALLDARLEEALFQASEKGGAAAVLFLDLDEFKAVNDTHSHRIGDLYLCEVAKRFQSCLRDSDTLARVGGDEFIIVIADLLDPAQSRIVASRLIQCMRTPVLVEGLTISGSVSVGMAIYPRFATTAGELKHLADAAMYNAKRAGGDRFVALEPAGPELPGTTPASDSSGAVPSASSNRAANPVIERVIH